MAETASSYASSVSNYAEDIGRGAAEQTGRLAQQAQSTLQETITRVVQEQPLAVALAGIAAGAAVAAAFPVSELENRTLGTTGGQIREAAGKAGGQLKDAASKAGQRLAAAADERGLNTQGFKEVARDVGAAFSEALENGDKRTDQSASRASASKPTLLLGGYRQERRPKLSDVEIGRLERDVETARAKLSNDLARLRSPAAFDEFTESTRDVIVDHVKASATSVWQTVVDNLKDKAAENPAATMAIGAGLVWRVFRHPPIATALIGAGLFSLLRTSSTRLIMGFF